MIKIKEYYVKPEIEIIRFSENDIITASYERMDEDGKIILPPVELE